LKNRESKVDPEWLVRDGQGVLGHIFFFIFLAISHIPPAIIGSPLFFAFSFAPQLTAGWKCYGKWKEKKKILGVKPKRKEIN